MMRMRIPSCSALWGSFWCWMWGTSPSESKWWHRFLKYFKVITCKSTKRIVANCYQKAVYSFKSFYAFLGQLAALHRRAPTVGTVSNQDQEKNGYIQFTFRHCWWISKACFLVSAREQGSLFIPSLQWHVSTKNASMILSSIKSSVLTDTWNRSSSSDLALLFHPPECHYQKLVSASSKQCTSAGLARVKKSSHSATSAAICRSHETWHHAHVLE